MMKNLSEEMTKAKLSAMLLGASLPMMAFKPGALAVAASLGVALAVPQLYERLKSMRLSIPNSPLAIAVMVMLALWLISASLSIYPQKALGKLGSVVAVASVCFLLFEFMKTEERLEAFGKSLVFVSFFVGGVYAVQYFIGAVIEPAMAESGNCKLPLTERSWIFGELHCFLPNNWLFYPLAYVSLAPILSIIVVAAAMKYHSCRIIGLAAILLFAFQTLMVQQKVSALFAAGILVFIPAFYFIRNLKPTSRLNLLNYVFGALGILALGFIWGVGNASVNRGDELKMPWHYDIPRLLVWHMSAKKSLASPFFGSGPNTSDYALVNGEPLNAGLGQSGFAVWSGSQFPAYDINMVEFVRSGDDLIMFFPAVGAGGAFVRPSVVVKAQFTEEKFKTFRFLQGNFSFEEIKRRLKTMSKRLTNETSVKSVNAGTRYATNLVGEDEVNVLVGTRYQDRLVAARGISHIYLGNEEYHYGHASPAPKREGTKATPAGAMLLDGYVYGGDSLRSEGRGVKAALMGLVPLGNDHGGGLLIGKKGMATLTSKTAPKRTRGHLSVVEKWVAAVLADGIIPQSGHGNWLRQEEEYHGDLLVVKKGAKAILMDAFANRDSPRSCLYFRGSKACFFRRGSDGGDALHFPEHSHDDLTFAVSPGGDLEIIDDSSGEIIITVRDYKTRFEGGSLGGYFMDSAGKLLPAACGMYLPRDGKPSWDKHSSCPLPRAAGGRGAPRLKFYGVGDGIGQTHPHNWFLELLTDTGYLGTAAALIALALWFRYWLMHPSPWAWLPTALGFIWWLEALVNFSFWSNWWQLFFLLPAAFASAWATVYKGDKRPWKLRRKESP